MRVIGMQVILHLPEQLSVKLGWSCMQLGAASRLPGKLRTFCDRSASQSKLSADLPELTLFTKTPCPLCDNALEALAPLLDQVSLRKVDITLSENKHWNKLYRYDIPVFHFDGKYLMKHRGDMQVLSRALENWRASRGREGDKARNIP